jgi:hypothetical protein
VRVAKTEVLAAQVTLLQEEDCFNKRESWEEDLQTSQKNSRIFQQNMNLPDRTLTITHGPIRMQGLPCKCTDAFGKVPEGLFYTGHFQQSSGVFQRYQTRQQTCVIHGSSTRHSLGTKNYPVLARSKHDSTKITHYPSPSYTTTMEYKIHLLNPPQIVSLPF